MIDAYTRGEVAEEQMSALLMAILLNGMNRRGDRRLDHGDDRTPAIRLDLSGVGRPTVDKHSTGGVGDKISLPLAPLVAACGAAVPQLSGRGLGHTGGTLDKMESIKGWRAAVSPDEMTAQLASVGAVICAASADLAPADRKLYALRDVTGTVESIPMIAASIMSKKIAEGTAALVLDVKVGSGAFMKRPATPPNWPGRWSNSVRGAGVRTSALLTDMSTPLGIAVGNAVEVAESVEVLAGGGPADVVELTIALAREMVALAGLRGRSRAECWRPGGRWTAGGAMVAAQGGDPDAPLPIPRYRETVVARTRRRRRRARRAGRSVSPPGVSAPAAPGANMRCSRRPACSAWPSRGTPSLSGRRCSNCTPTPPTGSARRSTSWPAP